MAANGFGISKDESVKLIVKTALDEGIKNPKQIAYILATAEHESANFTAPEEYMGRQQARKLGYGGGEDFYGRGYVHLTHKSNYQHFDKRLGLNGALMKDLDLATEPEVAARILVIGMKEGSFTGVGLDKYINDRRTDYEGARRIINGTDKKVHIANLAEEWEKKVPDLIKEVREASFNKQSVSEKEDVHSLINGLMNDKNGSFVHKALSENKDVIERFDSSLQQKMREAAVQEQIENDRSRAYSLS